MADTAGSFLYPGWKDSRTQCSGRGTGWRALETECLREDQGPILGHSLFICTGKTLK